MQGLQRARGAGARLLAGAPWGASASAWGPATTLRCYAAAPAMTDSLRKAFGYCVEQVRQYDYLNYVWVAQMPQELRPALFALRAFNIETALIADNIKSKEAIVGQMRFQWWRDAVRSAYDNQPPNHPVVQALAHVLHSPGPVRPAPASSSKGTAGGDEAGCTGTDACGSTSGAASASTTTASGPGRFSRYSFKRIVDCREADFVDPQPPLDLRALEQYAEGTASQLMYLQLAAAGIKSSDADHAASHLGRAAGICALLRGTAAHAARRRSYLPVELCAEARVSQEDIYSGEVSEGLRDVVHKVASLAKGHLDEARRLAPRLPPGAAALMLPSLGVERFLAALEAANFNPFDPALASQGVGREGAPLAYVLAVKWHHFRGTY
ncbi:hypothetical protein HYH03_017327 [Edaphochlamys debaryana]|uniref:Phytoene synthase n=1 Tax=Edaphochlamys debaryana TaxID=47281 RepID=A0A836BQI5_9CHLO|nr:hypothetical protein HYH03_017327 [Edaphochlamys debaryana]|eukprot:KAG2483804.1 hypothetical protein HYH03_017327 [Edaphochlamys debaryana]